MFAIVFFSLLSFGSQKIPWGFTGSKIVGGGGERAENLGWLRCVLSQRRPGFNSALLNAGAAPL